MALFTPKTCFLRIPRTGTQYVRQAIRDARPKTTYGRLWYWEEAPAHRPYNPPRQSWEAVKYLDNPMRPQINGKGVVYTLVRHPVNWLKSRWKLGVWPEGRERCGCPFVSLWEPDFETFVKRYLDESPGLVGEFFSRYTDNCDVVGRTEDLPHCLVKILKDAGEGFDEDRILSAPRYNVTARPPDLSQELSDAICDAEGWLLETVQYTHDVPASRPPAPTIYEATDPNIRKQREMENEIAHLRERLRRLEGDDKPAEGQNIEPPILVP